jgi:putative Holliday junction resolvase
MRILAIDLGRRRVGLAVSDPEERFALPLAVLERRDDRTLWNDLRAVAEAEGVEMVVVGEPRRLDGSAGDAAQRSRDFAERVPTMLGLPVALVDEALTSNEAERRLGSSTSRRAAARTKQRLDAVAAQVLLEDFLAQRARPS